MRIADIEKLIQRDSHLKAVVDRFGMPDQWRRPPGFATLVLFILEQQVSLASAAAAYGRLDRRLGGVTPAGVLDSTDHHLKTDGFSRQKIRYARALAEACLDDRVDFESFDTLTDAEIRSTLTSLPGIGPWTADVYLIACLDRPDVWPVGDRALQVSTATVLGLDRPPTPEQMDDIGERWRPHRTSAAHLLWHDYLSRRNRP